MRSVQQELERKSKSMDLTPIFQYSQYSTVGGGMRNSREVAFIKGATDPAGGGSTASDDHELVSRLRLQQCLS